MSQSALAYIFIPVLISVGTIIWSRQKKRNRYPKPPGPKGYPLIGNLLDMPTSREHLTFAEWKKTYGDVIYLNVLGQPIVILNSKEAIADLLDARGAIYSDRPTLAVLRNWGGQYWALPTLPYGEEVHIQRRMLNQGLNPTAIRQYEREILKQSLKLADSLIQCPREFEKLVVRMTGATIIKIMYGFEALEEDDPWIKLNENLNAIVKQLGAAGSHPADLFPSLTKLPAWIFGRAFAENLTSMSKCFDDTLHLPYDLVKKALACLLLE